MQRVAQLVEDEADGLLVRVEGGAGSGLLDSQQLGVLLLRVEREAGER